MYLSINTAGHLRPPGILQTFFPAPFQIRPCRITADIRQEIQQAEDELKNRHVGLIQCLLMCIDCKSRASKHVHTCNGCDTDAMGLLHFHRTLAGKPRTSQRHQQPIASNDEQIELHLQAELACAQAELLKADDAMQETKQLWLKCRDEKSAAGKLKVLLLGFDSTGFGHCLHLSVRPLCRNGISCSIAQHKEPLAASD